MVNLMLRSHNSHQKSHLCRKKNKYGLYNMGWWNSKQYVVDLSDTKCLDSLASGKSSKIDITQALAEVKRSLTLLILVSCSIFNQ